MKNINLVSLTLFLLCSCDAVFHRYIYVKQDVVAYQSLESTLLKYSKDKKYNCKEIYLPNGNSALNCENGIIVELTENDENYKIRISTQTAFYEPSKYTKYYKGLSEKLYDQYGNNNVTVNQN